MKKILQKKIFLLLLLVNGLATYSQTAGDYQTTSPLTDQNWSNSSNWLTFNGSSWIPASDYPGQNSGTGTVTIGDNTQLILDQSLSQSINTLVISASASSASLTFGGAYTLNVLNDVTFSPTSTAFDSLNISTGTLICSNVTMNSTANQSIILTTGKLDIKNNLNAITPLLNNISITSSALLRIGNQCNISNTISFNSSSTIEFYSTANQSIPDISGCGNIIFSGSGTKSLTASLSVNGNITVNAGVELNDGGNNITGNSGSFSLLSNAIFTTSQVIAPPLPQNFATYSFPAVSTVNFNADTTYILPATPILYGNITVSGKGTVTLSGSLTVNGDITINSGKELNTGIYTITGASLKLFTIASGATYTTNRIATPWFPTSVSTSFDPNSTVNINGSGNFTFSNTVSAFGTLAFNGTGNHTLSNSITIAGNLMINAGNLIDGGFQIIGNATGQLVMLNGTTLTLGTAGSLTNFPTLFSNIILNQSSTVNYNSNQGQTISIVPTYYNLSLTATAAVTKKINNSNIIVNGTFTIGANNTFNDLGYIISCNGNITNNGIQIGSGGIKAIGTVTQNINGNGTYGNIEIAKTASTAQLSGNISVSGDINISSGNFTIPNTRVLTSAGNVKCTNGAFFIISPGGTLKVSNGKSIINEGTCTFVGSTSLVSKITINGTGNFTFNQTVSTAFLSARYYTFENCELIIHDGSIATGSNNLSNGTFSNGSGNDYINFDGYVPNVSPSLVVFNSGPTYNVTKTTGAGVITFANSSGSLGGVINGEANDHDNGLPGTLINWTSGTVFYSKVTGSFGTNTVWVSDTLLNSGNPTVLTDYSNGIYKYIIRTGHTITVDRNLDVNQIYVRPNATLTIGNNATARTVQVEDDLVDSGGVINVGLYNITHTINLYGDLKIDGINSSFDLYNSSLTGLANVNFYCSAAQNITGTPGFHEFNSINLGGLTTLNPSFILNIKGNITLGLNTIFNAGGYRHTISGNWTGNGGVHNSTGIINFNGTNQVISGNTTFNNISFSGGSASFGGTASTITINGNLVDSNNTTLTIGNQAAVKTIKVSGDVTIYNGSTMNVGNFGTTSYFHSLSLNGSLNVNGTLEMIASTSPLIGCNVSFLGNTSSNISGSSVTTCHFNSLTVNKSDTTILVEVLRPITQTSPTANGTNITITSGTFKVSSASTLTPYFGNATICAALGKLWINNTGASISCVGSGILTTPGVATISGSLQVSHGTFNYGSGNDRPTLGANSNIIIDGSDANLNIYGSLYIPSNSTLKITNGNVTVDCQRATVGGDNFSTANTHLVDLRGKILFTGGTLTISNPSLNATANNYSALGLTSLVSGSTFANSTIQFGNGTQTGIVSHGFDIYNNISSNPSLGNIIVNGNAALSSNRFIRLNGTVPIVIGGDLTINANSELQLNGKTLNLQGNLINNGTLNSNVTNSILCLNGSNLKPQSISGSGTFSTASPSVAGEQKILNVTIGDNVGSTATVDIQTNVTIQNSLNLTSGTLSQSVGSLTMGINTGTLTISRINGSLLANPMWISSGVTYNIIYKATTNIFTGNELPGSNANIGTLTINNANGVSTLLGNSNSTVKTSLILTSGIFNLQNNTLYQNGSISRNGTTQTGTISTGTGASFVFGNTANIAFPAGCFTTNPTELSNITLTSGAANYVSFNTIGQNIILDGILTLNSGILSIGNNTLTFQTSNTPIVRNGTTQTGTISTATTTNITFNDGSATPSAYTIPNGTFLSASPSIANFTVNRTNLLKLGNQRLLLYGTLTLTNGEFDNNGLILTTYAPIPFAKTNGTLTMGTASSLYFYSNATAGVIPDNFFTTSPTISAMSMNRIGGITFGNQTISLTAATNALTLTSGIITLTSGDFIVQSVAGTGGNISSFVKQSLPSSTGLFKRPIATTANTTYIFPVGTGTVDYSPVSLTFVSNTSTSAQVGIKPIVGNLNTSLTSDYLNKYWSLYSTGFTAYTINGTFSYPSTDVIGSTESNFMPQLYNGSTSVSFIQTGATDPTLHNFNTGQITQTTNILNGYSITASNNPPPMLFYWSKAPVSPYNWTTISNWETTTSPIYASPSAATTYPTSLNNRGITIKTGHTITLDIASLSADSLNLYGTLTLGGNSLKIKNNIGTDFYVGANATITTTTGQIIPLTSGTSIVIDGTFKTSNVNGFSGSTTTSITSTNIPSLTLNTSSTIEYNGAAQTITTTNDYSNLKITAAGIKTVSNSINIKGDITISAGTLTLGTVAKTVTISGNLLGSGTGIIDLSGAPHTLNLKGATNTLTTLTTNGLLSTITYNGSNQTVFASPNYENLKIFNLGTKTISNTLTVNNTLTIDSSATFSDNAFICTVKGGIVNKSIHSGTGKITFSGSIIDCGGTAPPSVTTFGNLEINSNSYIKGNIITLSTFKVLAGNTFTFNTISKNFVVNGVTDIYGSVTFTDTTGSKTFKNTVSLYPGAHWISLVDDDYEFFGNVVTTASSFFQSGNGKYILSGASSQNINVTSISPIPTLNISLYKSNALANISFTNLPTDTILFSNISLESGNLGSFNAPTNAKILGDLTLHSGNSGIFNASTNSLISGNITLNGGTLNWGTMVNLNGTKKQIIQSNTTIPTFLKLAINNSSSDSGIILKNPITVNTELTLTKGKIITTSSDSVILLASASLLGTFSDQNFIDGKLTYFINSSAITTKVFPVGKNGKLHQADLIIKQKTAVSRSYTCEFFNKPKLTLSDLYTHHKDTVLAFSHYWHINKSNEVLDAVGNDPELDSAAVKFYNLSFDSLSKPNALFAVKSNGKTNKWMNVGGTINLSGKTMNSGYFKAFCDISSGTCVCDNPLPISLTEFSVQTKNSDAIIRWETESETNNDYFNVERSFDGRTWTNIYTCRAAGNSTRTNIYSFVDNNIPNGIIYYRLKQTDINGDFTYSNIRSINANNSDMEFTLFPNPTTADNVNIVISNSKEKEVLLQITDEIGRTVYRGMISTFGTQRTFNLQSVCQLTEGIFYTISIISDGKTISKKIALLK